MEAPRRRDSDGQPRRLRKGMYILPSLFTTANLAAGFYAITQAALGAVHAQGLLASPAADPLSAASHYFDHAAIAIGFAVFFDGMDGAIARLTHTTSDFGKELDSLADVVAFGVAPGILAWMWGFFCLPSTLNADLRDKLVEFGAIIAFAFLTAGACRLARFNIQLNPQPKNPGRQDRKYIVGMTIPPYQMANTPKSYDPERPRRLLLAKKEIATLLAAESKKGLTIIPFEVYTAGRFVKARIAIVRGKGKSDRREDLKKRDAAREVARTVGRYSKNGRTPGR